jgi:hypothetical protein
MAETCKTKPPLGAFKLNVPSELVMVAALLALTLTVADATSWLFALVTLPVTCLVCANVAENMHIALQKINNILFIGMLFV